MYPNKFYAWALRPRARFLIPALAFAYAGIIVNAVLVHDVRLTNGLLTVVAAFGSYVALVTYRRFKQYATSEQRETVKRFGSIAIGGFVLMVVTHASFAIALMAGWRSRSPDPILVVIPEIVMLAAVMLVIFTGKYGQPTTVSSLSESVTKP